MLSAIFCSIEEDNIDGLHRLLSMASIDINQTNQGRDTMLCLRAIHCWASRHSLDFEDEDLGSSPGWWAATVATYCPSRPRELPKFLSSKPCE